jgi:fatty acid desaturase
VAGPAGELRVTDTAELGPRTGSDFAPLLHQVRDLGLLRLRRRRYAVLISTDVLALVSVGALIEVLGNTWWQMLFAVPVGILTVRLIFVGHDVGHRQIARTRRINTLLGFVFGDTIVGLSSRWWLDKHSRHHANPNAIGRDPDVVAGAICWTAQQTAQRPRMLAWFGRQQGRLFLPLLVFEALNLHVSSLRSVRRPREVGLLVVHASTYFGLLWLVMGPGKAAVFVIAHQAVVGVHLGCAFAPNHKGMPMPPPGSRWDFMRKQVLTTRNVRGGPFVDWFLGGLNYQIE